MDTMGSMGSTAMRSRLTNAVPHGTLAVRDYGRAKAFYGDTLGLRIEDDPAIPRLGRVWASGSCSFVIYENAALQPPQNTVLTFETQDFDATIQELRDRGVRFEEYDVPEMGLKTFNGVAQLGPNMRTAWFKDTEGNILSVASM